MTRESLTQSTRFKIGWITLLILSVLSLLQHVVLIFAILDEAVLFIGWSALNIYTTLILTIPFRRGERWAWYSVWVLVIAYASMIFFDPQIGVIYVAAAVIMAGALLLTAPAFFHKAA